MPCTPPVLALFIAFLFSRHYAPSTVHTYISAIGYSHKLLGFSDPSKIFYISQMLKGYSKIGFRLDSRLPISLPILHRLISSAPQLPGSPYQICQFQAMCSLAFFAFLKVGEMSISSNPKAAPPLQLSQLSKLLNAKGKIEAFKVSIQNFKHSYNQAPFSLIIYRQQSFCPVQLLLNYIVLRGTQPGPFFSTVDGAPVSRTSFTDLLSLAIRYCGLDPSRYKGHSFRIGAATHAAERGFSDTQIRSLGRWKTNAFRKYIRVPSLTA